MGLRGTIRLSRRGVLKLGAAGAGGSALAGLLAACGGSPNPSTTTSSGSAVTKTSATAAASPVTSLPTAQIRTSAASPTASPQAAGAASPKPGGDFVVVGHTELAGLSPNDINSTDQWVIITQIHNALVEMDPNFVFEPVLAEKFDTAPDGLTYTFNLRKGVKFHDGTDFSSADVKYTYDYYRDIKNSSVIANNFQNMDTVDMPEANTVKITMKAPNAAFIARGATVLVVQSKYHAQVGEKTYRTKPIGTGAFRLKEYISADHTTVEAFDQHFRGRPYLNTFTEKNVPEPSVRKVALDTGQADSSCWPLLIQDEQALNKQTDKFTNFTTVSTDCNHFPINNNRPYFADKPVRQALMFAINRQKMIDTLFQGAATLATANLAPALAAWYNPNVTKYDYNPDKAKQLLDASGWAVGSDGIREKDGQKFSFTCQVISGDQARKPEALLIQQDLKAVGIDMQVQEVPYTTINDGFLKTDKTDAAVLNWTYGGSGGDPDAAAALRSDGAINFAHYKSAEMDRLLDQGLQEADRAKRKQIYDQVQQLFAEDVPFVYLMYWQAFTHFTKRVKGIPASVQTGIQIYNQAYKWWIG